MKSYDRFIKALRKLPGVGPKQAERYANYFLKASGPVANEFSQALLELKNSVKQCSNCYNYCEDDLCKICKDSYRSKELLCVVEEPGDVEALEKAGTFKGYYFVLGGAVSPLEGVDFSHLRFDELVAKVSSLSGLLKEVVIATNPDTEGEATALYIAGLLKDFNILVTRIGYGVPLGANLEYTDELTLLHALKGRRKM